MNSFFFETQKSVAVYMALGLFLAACSSDIAPRGNQSHGEPLRFGPEVSLGTSAANAASPFLRFAPDGRLFAYGPKTKTVRRQSRAAHRRTTNLAKWRPRQCEKHYWLHRHSGKTWSAAKRVNSVKEAIQGEERTQNSFQRR